MKIDFLICGSLNQAFLSQIAMFRFSLDALGGFYKQARLVAVFGGHDISKIPERWQQYYKNIDVEWSHEPGEENKYFRAQHYHRFEVIRRDADMAILCDADTLLIDHFSELIELIKVKPALYGVIAHVPPLWKEDGKIKGDSHDNLIDTFKQKIKERLPFLNKLRIRAFAYYKHTFKKLPSLKKKGFSDIDWSKLSKIILGKNIELKYNYSFVKEDYGKGSVPFYINYGFLAGTPKLLKEVYRRDLEIVDTVAKYVGNWWAPQVSFALAAEDLELPRYTLPLRYNYPNISIADDLYAEELKNIIVFHYMATSKYDRQIIFENEMMYNKFIQFKLKGSDRIFQDFIIGCTKGKYPFKYEPQKQI